MTDGDTPACLACGGEGRRTVGYDHATGEAVVGRCGWCQHPARIQEDSILRVRRWCDRDKDDSKFFARAANGTQEGA
jgi:hypothetical protein